MAFINGGTSSEGDNSVGACEQQGAAVKISEEVGVTPVLEGTNESGARPININILNDYVLDHLFSFLPLADLKTCRLVNRSWNRFSNQAIQKRDYVLNVPEHRDGYPVETENIPKLVQLIRTSFQFPWTKFKVAAINIGIRTKRQLSTLLAVISPFVTELEIYDLRNVRQSLEVPNLQKLKLGYGTHATTPTGSNRKSLLQLVERASKLNDITIYGAPNTPLFMDLLEIPNCRKISRMSLFWWIEGKHLVRLSEMAFQLKYLNLLFDVDEVTVESVKALLQSQSTSLEELTLNPYVGGYPQDDEEVDPRLLLALECPRMEKLKTLRVLNGTLYIKISYMEMLPALKKLNFSAHEPYHFEGFFNDDIEPVETVEYLTLGECSRHPETVLQAARQFPKLRSIILGVSRNVLNIVGLAMPQLEEMELLFYDLEHSMDAILTGLLEEEVEALKGLPSSQLDVLERNKQPVHFLKNLKKLRLSSSTRTARRDEFLLSDFGCRFALLKMEHLQVFEIEENCSQISDQIMEIMRNKFVVRVKN